MGAMRIVAWIGGSKKKLSPDALPGGGEVSASGPMFWIARAGGQKVTIQTAQRGCTPGVPHFLNFFSRSRAKGASAFFPDDADDHRIAAAFGIAVQHRAELAGKAGDDPVEA